MQRAPFIAALSAFASVTAGSAAETSSGIWHVAIFRFAPAHVERALQAFRTMRTASRRHPGNLAYDVFRSPDDEGSFFIFERWASSEALAAHEQTAVFADVGRNVLARFAELHDTVTGSPLA